MDMIPQPPQGQGPIDPRGAFAPPVPPTYSSGGWPGPGVGPGGGSPPAMAPHEWAPPPPGMIPPPPGMMPPPMLLHPPPRRGWTGRFVTAVTVLSLALSRLANVFWLATSAGDGPGGSAKETSITEGDEKGLRTTRSCSGVFSGLPGFSQ